MAKSGKQRIPELESIDFTGAASIRKYSQSLRDLGRDLSAETGFGAEELYAVLTRQKGHPLLAGIDVKMRARKVAKRLHRASELFAGGAVEAVKLHQEFRLQFAEVLKPSRKTPAKKFDFDDE